MSSIVEEPKPKPKRKDSPPTIPGDDTHQQGKDKQQKMTGRPLPNIVDDPLQGMMMGTTTGTATLSPARMEKSFTELSKKLQLTGQETATLRAAEQNEYSNEEAAEAYAKINVEIRKLFYENYKDNKASDNNMLNFLMDKQEFKGNTCVQHIINRFVETEKLTQMSMPKPSSNTFVTSGQHNASMKKITAGQTRTQAETALCHKTKLNVPDTAVEIQGNYSIGAWEATPPDQEEEYKNGTRVCQEVYEDENFNQWEKMNCWLCGLPLSFSEHSKQSSYPGTPISCEHKQAVGSMILHNAGIQTAVPSNTLKRIHSNYSTPVGKKGSVAKAKGKRYDDSEIHPSWKEMVRSEGYGWAHSWCNMKKNQAPMFTVRHYPEVVKNDDGVEEVTGKTKIVYQMEIDNIYHFVKDLFDLPEDVNFLKDTGIEFTPGLNLYYFRRKDTKKKPNPIRIWRKDISPMDENEFNKSQAIKAFKNMIKMLIPSYYLLNSGNDVSDEIKQEREELLGVRTMFKGIDKLSIIDRFKDNFMRLANALPRKTSQILGAIKKIEEGGNTTSLPKIISTLFSCQKSGGLVDEDYDKKVEIEKNIDEFFEALKGVQNLTNIDGEREDAGMELKRISTFSRSGTTPGRTISSAIQRLQAIVQHGLSTVQEEEEEDGSTGNLKSVASLEETDTVGELNEDNRQGTNGGVPFSQQDTQILDSLQYGGGKRKKTRRKRRKIKKKTRKRIYFKDLLDDDVQSGGLLPRRIYFNNLL